MMLLLLLIYLFVCLFVVLYEENNHPLPKCLSGTNPVSLNQTLVLSKSCTTKLLLKTLLSFTISGFLPPPVMDFFLIDEIS